MASVVLGVAAAVAAPSLGIKGTAALIFTSFATGIGAVIDQQLIFPKIFSPDQQVPEANFEDFQLQTGNEGAPIKRCYGPRTRVAGTVFYISGIDRTPSGDSSNPGWRQFVDLGIGICSNQVNTIRRSWAEDKLVFDSTGARGGTDIVITLDPTIAPYEVSEIFVSNRKVSSPGRKTVWMSIKAPVEGPNLDDLVPGEAVQMAGWDIDVYNAEWNIAGNIRAFNDGSSKVRLFAHYLPSEIEEYYGEDSDGDEVYNMPQPSVNSTVTLTQFLPSFATKTADKFWWKYGGGTQAAPPPIIAEKGINNVPGFRHLTWVLIENFDLYNWGNRIPQFTFEVEEQASRTVGSVVKEILNEADLLDSEIDVTDVDDSSNANDNFRGYTILSPKSPLRDLEPIFTQFDLISVEREGKLVVRRRTASTEREIYTKDLAAREIGEDTARPLKIKDIPNFEMPREVNVRFINLDNDLKRGVAKEKINLPSAVNSGVLTHSGSKRIANREINLTLTPTEAQATATRMVYRAYSSRQRCTFQLPPSYSDLLEGEIAVFGKTQIASSYTNEAIFGDTFKVLISEANRGANGMLEYVGDVIDTTTATQTGVGDGGDVDLNEYIGPGLVLFNVMDVPSIDDKNYNRPGLYFAASLSRQQDQFENFDIYVSPDDDDANYTFFGQLREESVCGVAITKLPTVARTSIIDYGGTVDVFVPRGTLQSCTFSELMDDATKNMAVLGQEIFQFQNAELIEPGVYRLSTLVRGKLDTAVQVTEHFPGETFALYDEKRWFFKEFSMDARAVPRYFKIVQQGGSPLEATQSLEVDMLFLNTRPLSVQGIRIVREPTGTSAQDNIRIRWNHRTRMSNYTFQEDPTPNVENPMHFSVASGAVEPFRTKYWLQVRQPPLAAGNLLELPIETGTGLFTESVLITSAQATAAGIVSANPMEVRIFSANEIYGRGIFARIVEPT